MPRRNHPQQNRHARRRRAIAGDRAAVKLEGSKKHRPKKRAVEARKRVTEGRKQ